MRVGIIRQFVGNFAQIGYYNVQEVGLAKSLANLGIETYIFTLKDIKISDNIDIINLQENVTMVTLPAKKIAGHHAIIDVKDLDYFKLDIIQVLIDIEWGTYKITNWALKSSIPIIGVTGTVSSNSSNKVKKIIGKFVYLYNVHFMKKMEKVICKTPFILKKLRASGVQDSCFIPVGLDTSNFIVSNYFDKNMLRNELNIPQDKKVLLYIGRFEPEKNPGFAIELIKEINRNKNEYVLVMVGKGSQERKIRKKINKYNLQKNVLIFQNVKNEDIPKFYYASDIFLNTCDNEIFGMAILESMYFKCPVIAVKAPGPDLIVKDDKTGILIDNYDVKEWIKGIESLIEVEKSKTITINAKTRVESEFNWDSIAKQYLEIYEESIKN